MGVEEPNFINLILKKVANNEHPEEILNKVEKLLDDDAEVYFFFIYFGCI